MTDSPPGPRLPDPICAWHRSSVGGCSFGSAVTEMGVVVPEPDGGVRVEVDTYLLAEAASSIRLYGERVAFVKDGLGPVAALELGEIGAGEVWSGARRSWASALGRLAHALETLAFNTEAAAVAYEDADLRARPAPPGVLPPLADGAGRDQYGRPGLDGSGEMLA
jgi:hypothetical protein